MEERFGVLRSEVDSRLGGFYVLKNEGRGKREKGEKGIRMIIIIALSWMAFWSA